MNLTRGYPALAEALAAQPADAMLLDGEIVAPDAHGVPSFARLQRRMGLVEPAEIERAEAEIPVIYYVFDLLHLDGVDLRRVPLWQRRELLLRAVDPSARLQALEPIAAGRPPRLSHAGGPRLRGRGGQAPRQPLPRGQALHLLAEDQAPVQQRVRDRRVHGRQRISREDLRRAAAGAAGRRGSTGLRGPGGQPASPRPRLETIRARLDPLVTPGHPFTADPPSDVETVFVRPELVAEARFTEWTPDRHLRAPVFLRLRDDKPAPEARIAERAPRPDAGRARGGRGGERRAVGGEGARRRCGWARRALRSATSVRRSGPPMGTGRRS